MMLSAYTTTDENINSLNKFEVVNFGIYDLETVTRVNIPSSPTGKMSRTTIKAHKKTTLNIPAKIGTRFGVEYIVHSEKSDRINLNIKWIPDIPVTRKDGSLSKETSYSITKKTNYLLYAGYGFTTANELEPRSWKLQISSQGKLLLEKIFYVATRV